MISVQLAERTIVLVAVFTALRASEMFGLRWEAMDFLNQKPSSGSQFVKDYVRPFLVKHGVISNDYHGRCGLHVFRHSLTSVMIGEKLADPKTV